MAGRVFRVALGRRDQRGPALGRSRRRPRPDRGDRPPEDVSVFCVPAGDQGVRAASVGEQRKQARGLQARHPLSCDDPAPGPVPLQHGRSPQKRPTFFCSSVVVAPSGSAEVERLFVGPAGTFRRGEREGGAGPELGRLPRFQGVMKRQPGGLRAAAKAGGVRTHTPWAAGRLRDRNVAVRPSFARRARTPGGVCH